MRLNTRIVFAIACVSLLAFIVPAFGAPAPKGDAPATAHKPKAAQSVQKGKPKTATSASNANRLTSKPVAGPLTPPRRGWPSLVSEARKYLGTNPTARKKLWCATFMNFVLAKTGYAGTNSDAARSFAQYGHRISSPRVGAIAVLTRGKSGGHVGVVTGIDAHGNPIIISGNHGHRVGEGIYPASRVIAYVMPTESKPLTQVADRSGSRVPEATASLDSPITELIAAIEAEYNRGDGPAAKTFRAGESPDAPASRRTAEAATPAPVTVTMHRAGESASAPTPVDAPRAIEPETPHRTVQQTPDQGPVDPSVADLFGLKDRAAAPVPPRSVPGVQRPQHPQRPGRIAAAN
jgi:uncharacterized protein (TIGR02594 family)